MLGRILELLVLVDRLHNYLSGVVKSLMSYVSHVVKTVLLSILSAPLTIPASNAFIEEM
jgi:hypothetical protein